jgi:hypothetical protein
MAMISLSLCATLAAASFPSIIIQVRGMVALLAIIGQPLKLSNPGYRELLGILASLHNSMNWRPHNLVTGHQVNAHSAVTKRARSAYIAAGGHIVLHS